MAEMSKDEALAVFERCEVPHRHVSTGKAKELYSVVMAAGHVLAALVRRRDSETCATCDNQLPALDDHLFDRCSVPETAVLCWSMGNFCGAWKGKAQP
jgi:hypothetical protein